MCEEALGTALLLAGLHCPVGGIAREGHATWELGSIRCFIGEDCARSRVPPTTSTCKGRGRRAEGRPAPP